MELTSPYQALFLAISSLSALTTAISTTPTDAASTCYTSPLPTLCPSLSDATRSIPWGTPSFLLSNGTLCCDSLTQIRAGIDDIDTQLLSLLAQRAAYVREATRFKATLDTVDVPSRDQAVIEGAVAKANETVPRLPEVIARSVFEAIINGSVPFEECVWGSFEGLV
ncbi:hypothetical protein BGAL_0101g00110 [Botrytis galanthina]|uniref:Chorismate mutase domain-containing protein n=1 Tax=Botrytis galanthina TaxID=278940 RepID=A0A4S8RBG8_9HELO|nr:hypothetical protein BGAL_0101g00110 [Botrytis galanthina]